MVSACDKYGGEERCLQRLVEASGGKKNHLEDPGVQGRIILKLILKKLNGMVWIIVARDKDLWCAVVNAVINLRIP